MYPVKLLNLKISKHLLCSLVNVQYNVAILLSYVKIQKRNAASQKGKYFHVALHIEPGTRRWCGVETLQKYKGVKGWLKPALAIELSRLFFDDIIKGWLLHSFIPKPGCWIPTKRTDVILSPTFPKLFRTHFLTFFYKNRKYIKQHSFRV